MSDQTPKPMHLDGYEGYQFCPFCAVVLPCRAHNMQPNAVVALRPQTPDTPPDPWAAVTDCFDEFVFAEGCAALDTARAQVEAQHFAHLQRMHDEIESERNRRVVAQEAITLKYVPEAEALRAERDAAVDAYRGASTQLLVAEVNYANAVKERDAAHQEITQLRNEVAAVAHQLRWNAERLAAALTPPEPAYTAENVRL